MPAQPLPRPWAPAPEDAGWLAEQLRTSRLTVLCGDTDDAMTRLLRDGVLPRLQRRAEDREEPRTARRGNVRSLPDRRRPGLARAEVGVYFDGWELAPRQALTRKLREAVLARGMDPEAGRDLPLRLADKLMALSGGLGLRFILVFDHFEACLRAPPERADLLALREEIFEAINAPKVPAQFLIALREDCEPLLEQLRGRILGFDAVRQPLPSDPDPASRRAGLPPASHGAASPPRPPTPQTAAVYASIESWLEGAAQRGVAIDPQPAVHAAPSHPLAGAEVSKTTAGSIAAPAVPPASELAEPAVANEPPSLDAEATQPVVVPVPAMGDEADLPPIGAEAELAVPASDDLPIAETSLASAQPQPDKMVAVAVVDVDLEAGLPFAPEVEMQFEVQGVVPEPVVCPVSAPEEPAPEPESQLEPEPEFDPAPEPEARLEPEPAVEHKPESEPEPAMGPVAEAVFEAAPFVSLAVDAAPPLTPEPAAVALPEPQLAAGEVDIALPLQSSPGAPLPERAHVIALPGIAPRPRRTAAAVPGLGDRVRSRDERPARSRAGRDGPVVEHGSRWRRSAFVALPALAVAVLLGLQLGGAPDDPAGLAAAPGTGPAMARSVGAAGTADAPARLTLNAGDLLNAGMGEDLARALATAGGLAVQPSRGWRQDLRGLRDGAQLAVARRDALQEARADRGSQPLRIVMPLVAQELAFVVRADSPLRHIHQIDGRRINVGAPDGARALTVRTAYESLFGRTLPLAKASFAGEAPALEELLNRSVDVVVLVGNAPAPWASAWPEMMGGLRLLSLAPEHPSTRRALANGLSASRLQPGENADARTPPTATLAMMSFLVTGEAPTARVDTLASSRPSASSGALGGVASALCRQLPWLQRDGHPKWRELAPGAQPDVGWPYAEEAEQTLRDCGAGLAAPPARLPGTAPVSPRAAGRAAGSAHRLAARFIG